MSDIADVNAGKSPVLRHWLIDVFVLVFFLTTAITGLYLFRRDLMRTLEARNVEPVGIIIIRNNVVQRRYEDRMVWDRLYVDSFVYSGDLVRAAEVSSASIHIDENKIDLNENTLIRIQYSAGKSGPLEIEVKEGNLSLASGTGGTAVMLNLMGSQVYSSPGAVLNADVSQDGVIVQVNEGNASLVREGQTKKLAEGSVLAKDSSGAERIIPAAVVKRPAPNAGYLKNSPDLLPINFIWNRVNLGDNEKVRLEISGDRNFTQGVYAVDNLDSNAQTAFDPGLWYWRLRNGETVLSTGQLTVADGTGPELLSPVTNSVIRYKINLPQIRFQWAERAGAVQYIVEVSDSKEFINLKLNRESAASSFIYSGLGEGTWYWRVRPVFSSAYEGSTGYSDISFFKIEEIISAVQGTSTAVQEIEVPESAPVKKTPVLTPALVPQRPKFSGVAVTSQAKAGKPKPASRVYIVREGDTLARIAAREYGDPLRYMELARINELPNPDLIFIDQALFIP
ncbi:MAG: LysM peptidoglycan-binding domain-containing protein [Treponema sp.]|nr:LysM peptidoglycan-binding domain-containing protein [Treponema sp.]